MPRLIDTQSRAGTLAAAVNELLITDGIPGLSLRRIAAVSRVSAGSIIHHLGGKDRLLSLSVAGSSSGAVVLTSSPRCPERGTTNVRSSRRLSTTTSLATGWIWRTRFSTGSGPGCAPRQVPCHRVERARC